MQIIAVSDIFGRTKAFEKLCNDISEEIDILDPYNGKSCSFENETEAYNYFQKNVGLEQYSRILGNKLKNQQKPVFLIGFSVGASAIWLNSAFNQETQISAICFYGSQIRHLLTIDPKFKVELIIPKNEMHFSVNRFQLNLGSKKNVKTHKADFMHGFMNSLSNNFDISAYEKYKTMVAHRINREFSAST